MWRLNKGHNLLHKNITVTIKHRTRGILLGFTRNYAAQKWDNAIEIDNGQ